MGWTPFQFHQYEAKRKPREQIGGPGAVSLEIPLHNKIIEYCNSKWPRWVYLHANPAAKSTIRKGAADFTIFLPPGRFILIECKARDGKLSKDQLIFIKEMEMVGTKVHVVDSFEGFLNAIRSLET